VTVRPKAMSAVTPPPLRSPHALCSSVAAGDFGATWRATLRTREVALLQRAAAVPAPAVSPGVLAFLTDRLRDDTELCEVLGAAGVQVPTAPQTIARETAVRSLYVDRGAFVLSFTYDAVLSRALRGCPERHYDQRRRAWLLPATREIAHRLRALLKGRGFHVTPDAAQLGARLLRGGVHAPWPRLEVIDASDDRIALWVAPLLRAADWPLIAELTAVGARYDARARRPGTWIVERDGAESDTRLRALLDAEGVQHAVAAPQGALEVPDTAEIRVLEHGERLGAWCLDLKRTRFDLAMPRDPRAGDTVRGFGASWKSATKTWAVPAHPEKALALHAFLVEHDVPVTPRALARLQSLLVEGTQLAQQRVDAQRLGERQAAELDTSSMELMAFQWDAVRQMLRWRRALLADEQGLGKTVELLATLEAADAYPAVVVCPASLKANWLNEIAMWVGHRSAVLLPGKKAQPKLLAGKDIVVLNYELLGGWVGALRAIAPRALVVDESHFVKDEGAQRTNLCDSLAREIPPDGLVLLASGTPALGENRNLISQLEMLGALEYFGGAQRFRVHHCGMDPRDRKRDDSGATNLPEMHAILRRRVMVRRLKRDVLKDLPDKLPPQTVVLELSNRRDYEQLESLLVQQARGDLHDDVRAIIASEESEQTAAKLIADVLAAGSSGSPAQTATAMRAAASLGKIRDVVAWCKQFALDGRKLVLFAHHRDTQRKLVTALPGCAQILGGQRDVEDQKARFQGPDCSFIVCSILAASAGHTLTAAADVGFIDLPHMPGTLQQCIDRCHRIGQRNVVTPWFFLGARTIDIRMAAVLDKRTKVLAAGIDGDVALADDKQILRAVIEDLVGGHARAA
jgi:SWI/SNF-related matrix-associated actin-dependent regulator 1 of chromatin subfamily A